MTDTQAVAEGQATPPAEDAKPTEAKESPAAEATAAQVEAEYKARLSGKDKAHAAEVATLRDQIEALTGQKSQAESQATAASTDVTTLQKQLAAEQQGRKEDAQGYAAELRKTKYPYAAEALDEQSLATMDEAKLSGLNARLTPDAPTPTPPVASSSPARESAAPKPIAEKTSDELKADLAKYGPAFAREITTRP